MKNRVYEYLDNKLAKDRKIYRSEIIKLYNEHPDTIATDIDFKISDIITSKPQNFRWVGKITNGYNPYDNALWTFKNNLDHEPTISLTPGTQGIVWNELTISKKDSSGVTLTTDLFNNNATISITYYNSNHEQLTYNCPADKFNAIDLGEQIKLIPISGQEMNIIYDSTLPVNLIITVNSNEDFYSSSELSENRWQENYGLTSKASYNKIIEFLNSWLEGLHPTKDAARAIPLPYKVTTNTTVTRDEEILRLGYIKSTNDKTLSEYTFWNYFVKYVLDTYYGKDSVNSADTVRPETIDDNTEFDADVWQYANNLIMDIYRKVKPGICDSILDNNNNIVNFSTDMECAALVNKITVKHYSK